MAVDVVIVDYGSGNTRSMLNALLRTRRDDQRVVLSSDPQAIADAERIVLPGVGAFAECRRKLDESGLLAAIQDTVGGGKPFLGVCVGMQILADEGHEFEVCQGLGWIPGVTRRIQITSNGFAEQRLPHVAWSPVAFDGNPLFARMSSGELFYFVHSYVLDCRYRNQIAATAHYGETFAAAVQRDNVYGTQFHPEKSAAAGLQFLENFCRWQP